MSLLWLIACADPTPDAPLSVARTPPWSELALPDARAVARGPLGLTVRAPGALGEVDGAWSSALLELGFTVERDAVAGRPIQRVFARGDARWSVALVEVGGEITVDLAVLPAGQAVTP